MMVLYALIHIGSFILPWGGVILVYNQGFGDHAWQGVMLILLGLARYFINSSAKGADIMVKRGEMSAHNFARWNIVDLYGKLAICIAALVLIAFL